MKTIENFKKEEFCKEIAKVDLFQICGGSTGDTVINLLR
ncbi:hypothetical protein IMCC3317_00990 [Kordia antarctica]|uniref:Uncharacterized protein n=1 Tax=Kordia antarctica TaxID=1218801 RepID=A0A7L4ZDJ4_9FLAO|nr:hypothetical protein IMCC3317_00990 [Kordia antarctica]